MAVKFLSVVPFNGSRDMMKESGGTSFLRDCRKDILYYVIVKERLTYCIGPEIVEYMDLLS